MTNNLKNDVIFKAFFAKKGNEKYLSEFLEAVLEIEIKNILIKGEVSLEKLFKQEKGGRLDLLAELNDGICVDIEMQVKKQKDYLERTSMYASKIKAREFGDGLNYNQIKKTILINILDFEVFPTKEYLSKTAIVLDKHREYEIIEDPKWYFIELPKFRKIKPDVDNPLEQWLLFIDDYDRRLIEMAENKNKTLKEARKEMEYLTGDEEIKRLVELRERWDFDRMMDLKSAKEEGQSIGRLEGQDEGKRQAKIEMVKKMLEKGENIEKIMEYADLNESEIKKIQEEMM